MLVTESQALPSAALGKAVFAECPRKGTRQSGRHSAKSRIPVVLHNQQFNSIIFHIISETPQESLNLQHENNIDSDYVVPNYCPKIK
jgi:hypothetical protein